VDLDWYSDTPPFQITPLAVIAKAASLMRLHGRKNTFPPSFTWLTTVKRRGRLSQKLYSATSIPEGTARCNLAGITGPVAALDGLQLRDGHTYMHFKHIGSKVPRPAQELEAFRRVTLQPGETTRLEMPAAADALRYWSEGSGG
jgi:hypothetical protein